MGPNLNARSKRTRQAAVRLEAGLPTTATSVADPPDVGDGGGGGGGEGGGEREAVVVDGDDDGGDGGGEGDVDPGVEEEGEAPATDGV